MNRTQAAINKAVCVFLDDASRYCLRIGDQRAHEGLLCLAAAHTRGERHTERVVAGVGILMGGRMLAERTVRREIR